MNPDIFFDSAAAHRYGAIGDEISSNRTASAPPIHLGVNGEEMGFTEMAALSSQLQPASPYQNNAIQGPSSHLDTWSSQGAGLSPLNLSSFLNPSNQDHGAPLYPHDSSIRHPQYHNGPSNDRQHHSFSHVHGHNHPHGPPPHLVGSGRNTPAHPPSMHKQAMNGADAPPPDIANGLLASLDLHGNNQSSIMHALQQLSLSSHLQGGSASLPVTRMSTPYPMMPNNSNSIPPSPLLPPFSDGSQVAALAALASSNPLLLAQQQLLNPMTPDFQAVYQAAFQTALLMQQQQQIANNMSMMMQAGQLGHFLSAGDSSGAAHLAAASQLASMQLNGGFPSALNVQGNLWPTGMNHLDPSNYSNSHSYQQGNGDRKKGGRMMMGGGGGGGGGGGSLGGLGVDDPSAAPYHLQTLEEVVGQLLIVAQDQAGCRFLQRKFDEGGVEAVSVVFPEILENVVELMIDPFGNYLIQKVLEKCSEQQRTEILSHVAARDKLVCSSLNMHGTRAMQKLIETVSNQEQRDIVVKSLTEENKILQLIKDLNGNHVVQRCLQRLGPIDSQFIYDVASSRCHEIATHRHGCCVIQRCIDYATPSQKEALVKSISSNSLSLSQDQFGNYCVQYVLDLQNDAFSRSVMCQLVGNAAFLSTQKFSSNVIEKCIKQYHGKDPFPLAVIDDEDPRVMMIKEILSSPLLPSLLCDSYGNYVVQSILLRANGPVYQQALEAIKPHLTTLRASPHGRRILQRIERGR